MAKKDNRVINNNLIFSTEHLISTGETLVIDKCDGKRILTDASHILPHVDSYLYDLHSEGADEVGQATPDTPVGVFELTKDGTFTDIYGSLLTEKDKLCLTQDQIIVFVEKYPSWVRMDGKTFFLFKSFGNFFVLGMYFIPSTHPYRGAFVDKFEFDSRLYAAYHHRFVVPQLIV